MSLIFRIAENLRSRGSRVVVDEKILKNPGRLWDRVEKHRAKSVILIGKSELSSGLASIIDYGTRDTKPYDFSSIV